MNGKVPCVVRGPPDSIRQQHVDFDLWMFGLKSGRDRGHVTAAKSQGRDHPQMPNHLAPPVSEGVAELINGGKHLPPSFRQQFTLIRQGELATRAIHQMDAEALFQPPQPLRYCGWRNTKVPRRSRKGLGGRYGNEKTEVIGPDH
jgi:hypothetical protein